MRYASSSGTGRTTRSAGASCSPTTRWATSRPPTPRPRAKSPARSTTGTTSTSISAAPRSPRAATGSAASAGSACSTSCKNVARRSGVELRFETDVADDVVAAREYSADLVIASDGLNSRIRTRYLDAFAPDVDLRRCRFVWLGTKKRFDAFTFAFVETEHGWFQAHAYQYDRDTSTFIVETPEEVWQKAGLERMSQEEGIAYCERLFAPWLDGERLLSNATHLRGSAIWIRFPRVVCRSWVHWNLLDGRRVPIVLIGDAAHTAHFSIGSGTKLALEDGIALTAAVAAHPDLPFGARRLRGRTDGRSSQDPECGAQFHRMVRKRQAIHGARSAAVRLQPVDAQPAHFA